MDELGISLAGMGVVQPIAEKVAEMQRVIQEIEFETKQLRASEMSE